MKIVQTFIKVAKEHWYHTMNKKSKIIKEQKIRFLPLQIPI